MDKNNLKGVIVGTSLAGLSAAIVVGLPILTGWILTHPKKQEISCCPSQYKLKHQDVSFKSKLDDIILRGWWIPAQVNGHIINSSKTIIISHGYSGSRNMFEKCFDSLIRKLSGQGYNLLLFDFRNSGESDGDLTSIGQLEKYDLLAAIDFAIQEKDSTDIGLIGFSMGAATSILAGTEHDKVKCIIADSPFNDLTEYLNENLSVWSKLPKKVFTPIIMRTLPKMTGLTPEEVSPKKAVKNIKDTSLLLIHSKSDTKIPYQNSEDIYRNVEDKGKVEIWFPEKGDHVESFVYQKEEYEKKALSFFKRKL